MRKFLSEMRKNGSLYLMALPGMILFLVFCYLPMVGVTIAFKNYMPAKGIFDSPWAKPIFNNFKFFFKSQDAGLVTFNTLFYNIIFIVTMTAFAVLIAILFNELKGKYLVGFYKTVIILPFFLSWIIVEYIVYGFLNPDKGLLNQILVSLGYHSISWYSNTLFWRFMFPILNLWKGVGYTSVVYLAAISGISPDYYEAAEMDGATKVQKAFRITIPMISPIIITMILLSAGRIFYADLGLFYYVPMNSGMLFPSTNVIDTYVYRALMGATNSFAMSTAVGLYQSLVGLILVLLSNKLVKKYYPDSSLF